MQKELEKEDSFSTREALRFDISQSFDLIEATGSEKSENKRPFSDLRFDLDSRLHDNLELNFDSTFDVHENVLKSFNIELGVKPIDSLYLFFDRRYTKNSSTFFIAGADWNLGKGWRIQGTTRYDEKEKTFCFRDFQKKMLPSNSRKKIMKQTYKIVTHQFNQNSQNWWRKIF